jgi:hypothetical protein
MLLTPGNSVMSAMFQVAEVAVPASTALPEPPWSFDQVTSNRRMLSVAVPLRLITGVVTVGRVGLIVRFGRNQSKRM